MTFFGINAETYKGDLGPALYIYIEEEEHVAGHEGSRAAARKAQH